MSAFKIVQKLNSIDVPLSGIVTSNPIALKSGYLRIKPENDCYLEIGYNPIGVNTNSSLWVDKSETVILKESVASGRVIGVTTGTYTIIDFPQGTQTPVSENDYVELTGIQPSGINTSYSRVQSVNTSAGYDGYFGSRITLDWDTSSIAGIVTVTQSAEVRKAIKLSILDGGFGPNKIHITEVQVVSNFN